MITSAISYIRTLGLIPFLRALQGKILGIENLVEVEVQGISTSLFLRVPSSDFGAFKQIFVDNEYAFYSAIPPHVIVDAGANIGLAALYFSNKYPNAKIFAIEPEEKNFRVLQQNVIHYPNIIPINAALWSTNGSISLLDPGLGHWGFMTEQSSNLLDCHQKSSEVKSITLDELMRKYQLKKIDILKIDIEGAEKEVFQTSSTWIDNVNSIIIELHEHMKCGCARSFYNASNGFDKEWRRGENTYLSRNSCITPLE